ncbi:MAG: alpha/beta hydrolase, partial [Desulfobacula sp.]|nr:alpha/beta hydrolase [Desulfobacula sp.]
MIEKKFNNKLLSTKNFEDLYPFESNFININGNDLHYIDKGEGRPVIMVHGNPTWSFYFRNLIQELSQNCRAIALD